MKNIRKVVFILAVQDNVNNIKRIEEFSENGYEVEAYSFYRGEECKNKSRCVEVKNIGSFANDLPYHKRLGIMYKGIKAVLKKTSTDKCLYYLIRQDVAMVFHFLSNRPYIYEEADMTHVTFANQLIRSVFEYIDKSIIKKSILSVFRSEGFLKYHFRDRYPENVYVIPNRLDKRILDYPRVSRYTNIDHLRFGFVGVIRYDTIHKFAQLILDQFPQHEVHYYGVAGTDKDEMSIKKLSKFENFYFHGPFSNPSDLPSIYENIDLVLSTYDLRAVNHKYAEPNKFYESIFFNVPIIVSEGGFLSSKVSEIGVGFSIDISNDEEIVNFVKELSVDDISQKVENSKAIRQEYCINDNKEFFDLLKHKMCDS